MRTVSSLRGFVACGAPPGRAIPGSVAKVADVLATLKRFRLRLESHFATEERSGLFDDIVFRLPAAHAEVERLRREHDAFLGVADAIIHGLARHEAAAELATIRGDLRRFLDAFQRHERREDALFQEAYMRDLGGAD